MSKPSKQTPPRPKVAHERRVLVRDLWVGDRFVAYGNLWTYLGACGDGENATARQHCKNSLALGAKGYGYIGDTICSFKLQELVKFQPPEHQNQ